MIVNYVHTSGRSMRSALLRANAQLLSDVHQLRSELEAANRRAHISLTALQLFPGEKAACERREAA